MSVQSIPDIVVDVERILLTTGIAQLVVAGRAKT